MIPGERKRLLSKGSGTASAAQSARCEVHGSQTTARPPAEGDEIDQEAAAPLLQRQDFDGPGFSADAVLLGGTEESLELDLHGWLGGALDMTLADIIIGGPDCDVPQLDFGSGGAFAATTSQTPPAISETTTTTTTTTTTIATMAPSSSSPLPAAVTGAAFPADGETGDHDDRPGEGDEDEDEDEFAFSFPDSYLLPVPELALLRAFGRIARRLGCGATAIWELGARSPFAGAAGRVGVGVGVGVEVGVPPPPHLRPTAAQRTVPHHPILDLLPWPGVRDRLITVLSDGWNRIWGPDVYDPAAWEVGQVLFERWWFVFDRQVIEQSNYWRRMRGARELSIGGSSSSSPSFPPPVGGR